MTNLEWLKTLNADEFWKALANMPIANFSEEWLNKEHKSNGQKTIGDCERGSIVKIGGREYIILDQSGDTTAVITKEFATKMKFGKSGNYLGSDVRSYCNGEFCEELANVVGKKNIIQHTVKLEAADGTGKGTTCKDYVSIITIENYRRYKELLKPYGDWWWTATRVNSNNYDYTCNVCYVNSDGVLDWNDCHYYYGVRPFCILNNKIEVEEVKAAH